MWRGEGGKEEGDVKPGDVIGDAKLAEKPVEVVVNDRYVFCVVLSLAFTSTLECVHILMYIYIQ